jgi:hypothetical protein
MGGGLMQLVAYGAQDIYLTGQPQITFFKSVYRRHTNFAIESIQQTINGSIAPGSRVSITISRNGDLLKNLWIQYNPSKLIDSGVTSIASDLSHALLQYLEIEIGGQLIDRHYGTWLTVWRDLTEVNSIGAQGELGVNGREPALNNSVSGNPSTKYQRMSYTHQGGTGVTNTDDAPSEAYIPMRFWFCRNPGLAIPLIALQYHDVKFNITFNQASSWCFGSSPVLGLASSCNLTVYADYVYLDTTERRQFAQNAHEYLIDQLQTQQESSSGTSTTNTIRLNFNHPVKELIWIGAPAALALNDSATDNVKGAATPSSILGSASSFTGATTPLQCKIILNGTDRFTQRNLKYFTRNQIYETHTGFGATGVADSIAVYSFALRPEEHQPSGTCNFSRIDTAQLYFSGDVVNALYIYAVNYNVLRIMSGMGGLAYSN